MAGFILAIQQYKKGGRKMENSQGTPLIVTFMFIIFPLVAFFGMALRSHLALKKLDSEGNLNKRGES